MKLVPLKNVADIRVSNVDKKSVEGERGVVLCNYVDVYKNDAIDTTLDFMPATATPGQIRAFRLRRGDSVITKDSETAEDIAVPAYVREDVRDLVCGYHLAVIRPRSEIDPRFLYWCLASRHFQEQMTVAATGVTRFGLRHESIGEGVIPLPSLEEQRRIADFLDEEVGRLTEIEHCREGQVALLRERGEAGLTNLVEALERGERWVPLKRLTVRIEQGYSPVCDDAEAEPREWAVLRTSSVSSGVFKPLEHKRLPSNEAPRRHLRVRDGDLLVVRGSGSPSNVGAAATARTEGRRLLLSDLIFRVQLRLPSSAPAVAAALRSRAVRSRLELLLRGQSGQTIKLRSQDLGQTPVPAWLESDAVAAGFAADVLQSESAIQQALSTVTLQLEALQERKLALITAAVTGQIEVTSARGVA